jgi:hypothetical protein
MIKPSITVSRSVVRSLSSLRLLNIPGKTELVRGVAKAEPGPVRETRGDEKLEAFRSFLRR